ncbi:MAG: C-GCAxxG-C-C family protein [Actinomycetota bacterium]|nr:C-GCAxxG-C-C family protein [Actinomycetota bacterium]
MNDKKTDEFVKIAENRFNSGFNCAESTLIAVTSAMKIESDMFPRIASGFGGGIISRYGSICGALSGTIMAVGAFCGRDEVNNPEEKEKFYNLISIIVEDFKNKFGFIECKNLIGCDLHTEEGRKRFYVEKIHQKKCNEYVKFAARKGIGILSSR